MMSKLSDSQKENLEAILTNNNLFNNRNKTNVATKEIIGERHPWLIANTDDFDKKLYYQPENKKIKEFWN